MNHNVSSEHVFTFYVPELSDFQIDFAAEKVEVRDAELWKRMIRIVRLQENDTVLLFDGKIHIKASLMADTLKSKNTIFLKIIIFAKNEPIQPAITLAVGLTKRAAFEEIMYKASQMGATKVVPLITEKVQRKWDAEKEQKRLRKIIISAAEQSKNFILPQLSDAVIFNEFVASQEQQNTKKVFFEYGGASLLSLLQAVHVQKFESIILVVGPEGGLILKEQDILEQHGFEKISLTPTTLRSIEAVSVALGSIRSVTTSF